MEGMDFFRGLALAFAVSAILAPVAHVLEMPNKLQLDGPLWLAVQQNLYRGWGPFIGAPTELGALALSVIACWRYGKDRGARRLWLSAAGAYAGMLILFFVFNAPVNAAVTGWRSDTLPADWRWFRAKWEIGHCLAAILSCGGLFATLKASGYDLPDPL
jgi:hypothetical protein